jgi:hypothetical protein
VLDDEHALALRYVAVVAEGMMDKTQQQEAGAKPTARPRITTAE